MKRLLLTLICCSPLFFSPPSAYSLTLVGPSGEQAASYSQYGPISDVETLWGIATKLRPDSSVTIQQTLVALYKLNPSAFYQGDINKLIPNSTMQVPTYDFVSQQTAQEAIALINKYAPAKQANPKRAVQQPTPEVQPELPAVVAKPVASVIDNSVDKSELIALDSELRALQKDFDLVNEQLLVETEKNQALKLRLQPLYDQIADLQEQLDSALMTQVDMQQTIDDFRAQLAAVKQRPFSGPGMFNSLLRTITGSLTNLLIAILSPILLLLAAFMIILRINAKRTLQQQEQELAESTAVLMEESGQFDSLLTEDIGDQPEVDFSADQPVADTPQPAEPQVNEISLEDELECIDLSDADAEQDDPFGVANLAEDELAAIANLPEEEVDEELFASTELSETDEDDPFGIAALAEELPDEVDEDDPFGISALTEEISAQTDDDEDDPFGISALAEEENLIPDASKASSKPISAEEQADLDLAAQWESQLQQEHVDDTQELAEQSDTSEPAEITAQVDSAVAEGAEELAEQDDIDALLAEQDDIDQLLAGQDDIDELLAEQDDPEQLTGQDDIDDLLAQPDNKPTPLAGQDDIDELLAEQDGHEPQLSGQDDIDSLFAEQGEQADADDDDDDPDNRLAQQLSGVAFNGDVPLPKVDKTEKNEFIDIETLLENSDSPSGDEPYSEFNLDLGLDEFPDVINSQESLSSDDENEVSAQLDLARAYLEIDDQAGAKEILLSVLGDSDGKQRAEIEKLLSRIA